jgi:predicted nucleic acid-binding protein
MRRFGLFHDRFGAARARHERGREPRAWKSDGAGARQGVWPTCSTGSSLISIVSVGELFSFAAQFGWGRGKTEALKRLIEELVVVDIRNQTVLEKYAAIDAYLVKKGRRIGDNDLWIAATTAAAGAVLLTSDKDFDPLHDVFLTRIYFDPAVS